MNSLREFGSKNDEYIYNEGSNNNSLVNSLFEECKVEDYDNETLSSVMRSLEAEIAPVVDAHYHISQTEESSNNYKEESMLTELMEQMNGCSSGSQDNWEFPSVESTSNWSLEDIEYMMMVDNNGVNEFEEVDQEYSLMTYPSIAFEDDDRYNSLWNCSNEFMIYE